MKSIPLTPQLHEYLKSHTRPAHSILERVQRETAKNAYSRMQISPEQGSLMNFLARLIGARRYVEVGCFTGYSAIAVASGMAPGSQVFTLDINAETTAIAQNYFAEAGLAERISARLGDGNIGLSNLYDEFGPGSFDMAFIDADKTGIPQYYEGCLKLLRPGGLLLVDNVLWSGHVADEMNNSADTKAIRLFNDFAMTDKRVDASLLHLSDGIFLIRKRYPNEI